MIPKSSVIYLVLWVILAGCRQASITPAPVLCNGYPIKTTTQPNCIAVNSGTLIQTALNQQTQVFIDGIELTIQGTAYISPSSNRLTVTTLEGITLIGTSNTITALNEMQQVTIDGSLALSNMSAYDIDTIATLPLNQLRRSVNIISPTPTIEAVPTQVPDCLQPEDWTDEYQVQSGDTLSAIAQAVGESLIELQTANCLDNPNNLRVGQILNIPPGALVATQPAQTFTPSAVFFRADNDSLNSGECTTLRWDVQNIREIMLDNKIVTEQNSQGVCPTTTSTYTLTVSYFDGTQSQHQITIIVNEP